MTLDLVKGSQGVYQSFGNQLVPLSSHLSVTEDGLKLVVAAQKLAADKLQSPCVITDLFSSNRTDWQVTAHTHLGQVYQIKLSESAITHEIASINALNVSFLPALETNTPSYLDGFSLAATHYFKSHPVSESQLFSWKYTGPRVVLRDGRIQIKKGYPKAQIPIRHLYQREDMKRREEENQETIRVYVEFLTREIGERKLQEIQRTYGFDFKTIKYLEPKHIYLCNIGMNNIEHRDVIDLKKRISTWIQSHDDLNVPLLGEGHPFTNREVRGLIRLLGRDATLRDLAAAFPSEETNLNQLVKVLETSKRAQERMYTGRKFEAQIQGSYNREVSDSSTPRPWVDQQELLQVFETLKNPFPGEKVSRQKLDRFFFEMLTKVVVKKHLMRSEGSEGSRDGTWRVGALIPSPYRNAKGETVYYRVDQGVDSGHGKLWIVLRPAREDADPSLPVIRVPRDTCPSLYTQRGGPTFTRDLAENAGYHNSATTFEEDREFFKEFTLPLWMAHFATALMHYKEAKKTQDYSQLDEPISNTYKELIGNLIAKAQTGKLDPEVKDKIKNALTPYYLDFKKQKGENKLIAAQKFISVLLHVAPYDADDFNRLHHLLQGNPPRPVASIGNSLGGFDAQQDLFAHTFRSGRVPVTDVFLYTHSALKISREDDNVFSNYVVNNAQLLRDLGVHISIDHITEINDPVTMTEGTLLGQGTQMAALSAQDRGEDFPVSVSFRVVRPVNWNHPELKESSLHRRRFEDLVEGSDYEVLEDYRHIYAYDQYAEEHKVWGRTVEAWRQTGVDLGLGQFSQQTVAAWRHRKGAHRHIPKALSNQKLVVFSGERGESYYRFIPVQHRRDLENILYVPIDYSELLEIEQREEHVRTISHQPRRRKAAGYHHHTGRKSRFTLTAFNRYQRLVASRVDMVADPGKRVSTTA